MRGLRLPALTEQSSSAILLAYFFFSELGAHSMGVLSTALLVKRSGAAQLPFAYLLVNVFFLPILLATLLMPPSSSLRLVRGLNFAYAGAFVLMLPATYSAHPVVLLAVAVVARVGKLLMVTFGVGMVGEILSVRQTRALAPRIMAATSAGIMVGGLLMRPAVDLVGIPGTFAMHTAILALAALVLFLIPAGTLAAAAPRPGASPLVTLRETLRDLLRSPMVRLIAAMEFMMVANRNVLNYIYSSATGAHFASEEAMASFSGSFEATMLLVAMCAALAVTGPAMRRMRIGLFARVFPSFMIVAAIVAIAHPSFVTLMACVAAYILGLDVFGRPTRQVLVAGVPPEISSRTVVMMAVAGGLGSTVSSIALVPVSRADSSLLAVFCLLALAVPFLIACVRAGTIYTETLSGTLAAAPVPELPGGTPHMSLEPDQARLAALSEQLSSGDPEVRRRAVDDAARGLGPAAISRLAAQLRVESDPVVRAGLVSAIGAAPDAVPAADLMALASDAHPRVRANALEALGERGQHPEVLTFLRERCASSDPRERAAAIVALIQAGRDAADIERAADALEDMCAPAARPEERAAAASAMGRLGHAVFGPDLVELLADEEPAVRASAGNALAGLRSPAALEQLGAAIEREPDPQVRARLMSCRADLARSAVGELLGVVDGLDRESRRRVVATLGRASDVEVLRRVAALLAIPSLERPAELIEEVHASTDLALLGALDRCLAGQTAELAPLMAHLDAATAHRTPEAFAMLAHLAGAVDVGPVIASVTSCTERLWRLVVAADVLSAEGSEEARGASDAARRGQARELDYAVSLAAALSPSPERARHGLRIALGTDRRLASVSLEVLEGLLPPRLREKLFPVLEEYPDPALRARRAQAPSERPAPAVPELIAWVHAEER